MDEMMDDDGIDRRGFLKCMGWAGTAMVWTVVGGVPVSSLLGGPARASGGYSFGQTGDSHLGFNKPATPDVTGTLKLALDRVKAEAPAAGLLLHTGDITHLSRPDQFDTAEQLIGATGLHLRPVP